MTAWYSENDPFAADWLENLIAAGQIAPGVVDRRDIRNVRPSDIAGFTQCHFFAGIGVWSYALRAAGWPDDEPIWTGSCPCQPFSNAGARKGFADERHLWPHWFWLVKKLRPAIITGEQVASKDGEVWLDLVSTDLEAEDYAFGAADLCAAGFGAAHRRHRHYFVALADSASSRLQRARRRRSPQGQRIAQRGMLDAYGQAGTQMLGRDGIDWLRGEDGKWRPVESGTFPLADAAPSRVGELRAYGNALDAETATGFVETLLEIDFAELI